MKQDLLIGGCGIIAVGLAIWSLWGNPPKRAAARVQAAQQLSVAPELKRVSEESPFMRSER
jgi:hypothetical protein